ncbi:Het domain protein [Mycena sanguinolenta]|uniref:Het domain protein n=1 Tax=Mycena sanguinolenta TaxID=230812 RepID=A0A8H6XTM0_9AGAR|nr:Het domain protein [Mycena sanguinolenta]
MVPETITSMGSTSNVPGAVSCAPQPEFPPSNIDFSINDFPHPYSPTNRRYVIPECVWQGGKHDGFPLVPLKDYRKVRCADLRTLSWPQRAALEQSLLTFGLLEHVMQMKIPESFLLKAGGGGTPIISGENMSVLLRDWRVRVKHHGTGEKCRSWAADVEVALLVAHRLLIAEVTYPRRSLFRLAKLENGQISAILTTIAAVADTIHTLRAKLFPPEHRPPPGALYIFNSLTAISPMNKQLISRGWYPFTTSVLAAQGFSVLGYASTQHPALRVGTDEHVQCSTSGCAKNNIDICTYTSKHVHPQCSCAIAVPPAEHVSELLSQGVVPVIVPQNSTLTVRPWNELPYVAISHVWVDGLGSTTEEGLPSCQVERLVTLTQTLLPGGGIWMDSMCIPKEGQLRKGAIRLMKKTYAEAAAVLVIDSGIQTCSTSAPLEEKLMRVLASGWMQRLWTLQEALLACKLCFQFSDGVVNIEDLIPVKEEDSADPLLLSLGIEVFRLTHFRVFGSKAFNVAQIARALKWRTTSRAEDETLAIAGLMDIDAGKLVDVSGHERMKTFFLLVGKVPPSIIFAPVERLSIPGFRWAPRTLMIPEAVATLLNEDRHAECTPGGLLSEYEILRFPETEIDEHNTYAIKDSVKEQTYQCRAVSSTLEPATYTCNAILVHALPWHTDWVVGAAVYVTEEGLGEASDDQRLTCEFRRRVHLIDVWEGNQKKLPSREPHEAVMEGMSCRSKVLLT